MLEQSDCVVIGGGPAGSTFAAITKKHAPSVRVTVLEQARFPRYHIGESTIPAANNVFREMGVMEALERSDFVKKMGITFVWGRDRRPWNADYLRLSEVPMGQDGNDVIDVTGQDFRGVVDRFGYLDTPVTAFNVRRAEFDQLLLDQARAFGAVVREGTRAVGVLRDREGRIEGVRWTDDTGRTGTISTPFVLDASGLGALLTKGDRVRDPHMSNFAVYGYLANAGWKVTFNGHRDRSTVFIAAVEEGWIWYFPVGPDVMSVGVVTRKDFFKERLRSVDPETLWWEMLRSCPEVSELIEHAKVRTDILPEGRRVAVSADWSSWARRPIGSGWAAAGDAAVFVDPILSSGVTLAVQSGHRAAYTYNTARERPDLPEDALWRAYADYIRGEYGSFLTLARYFYGNNRAAPSWWWQAQQLVNRAGTLELDDRQAFTMATAGFFPMPRAIGSEVVGSLLEHLFRSDARIMRVFEEDGLPPSQDLIDWRLEVVTPCRVDLRAEPESNQGSGRLDVYYDLVVDDDDLAHRLAAVPTRIPKAMAPVAEALSEHRRVSTLVAAAPSMLPEHDRAAVARATLDLVRVAALKGFVRLVPPTSDRVYRASWAMQSI